MIAVVICAAISKSGNNAFSNAVNTVLTPVQKVSSKVITPIRESFSYIGKTRKYKEENEELKVKNQYLEAQIKDISEYIDENKRLKELLDISNDMTGYETVAARVVGYEPDNWFSYLTIDKGTKDGIEESDTVITAKGLVGQVAQVGHNWAKISTIINSKSSAGVRIVRNGEIGIVEGDIKLSKTNKCKLGYLVENASVIAGDILETSGLGGIYPPGLMVGKITDVSKDNMGRLDYAVIEPFINFNKLYEVIVIKDWSYDGDIFDETVTDNHNSAPANQGGTDFSEAVG